METRRIYLQEHQPAFPNNKICTHKYTWYNWVPKSLIFQFKYAANVYFLLISILTSLEFSPKSPLAITFPFAIVLFLTMLKEAYEDYFRHVQDGETNKGICHIVRRGEIIKVKRKDLHVGDIVVVDENEGFPADICFLKSSNDSGLCFVNTMTLDGETNLKEKKCLSPSKEMSLHELSCLRGSIECDLPSRNLVAWSSRIYSNEFTGVLGNDSLLLRGCILKNTKYIVGVVVYTGHQTKIMMNGIDSAVKVSNIIRTMNKFLLWMFALQGIFCVVCAGLSINWVNTYTGHTYLHLSESPYGFFTQIFVFWVAYSHLIPLSLYISLDVVKLALAYFIGQDLDIYCEKTNQPARCRTSELIEELGQVQFIFSDKTGTLTCNNMVFKKCLLGDQLYTKKLLKTARNSLVDLFLKTICLCHEAFISENEEFLSASPDEIALLKASKSAGYRLIKKTQNEKSIDIDGAIENFEILAELRFTPERRRMSVLVKSRNAYTLLVKGADCVVIPRLSSNVPAYFTQTSNKFASEGLRTLVFAYKTIDFLTATNWLNDYNSLLLDPSTGSAEFEDLYASLESELQLTGVSAQDDQLQEGVTDTIDILRQANIRIWVLTGDKQETTEEVSRSCNLIQEHTQLLNLSSESMEELQTLLKTTYQPPYSIIINGSSLAWALAAPCSLSFVPLAVQAETVICCRSSPFQKKEVVECIKQAGN